MPVIVRQIKLGPTLIWNYNGQKMAKINKTITLTIAIVFFENTCSSYIHTSSNATMLYIPWTNPCDMFYFIMYGRVVWHHRKFAFICCNAQVHRLECRHILQAVTNIIFLAFVGVVFVGRTEPVVPINMSYVYALTNTSLSWIVWMTVIVAGNRYIAVCRPMVAFTLCPINTVRLEILIMRGAGSFFNIPCLIDHIFTVFETTAYENITMRNQMADYKRLFYFYIDANVPCSACRLPSLSSSMFT